MSINSRPGKQNGRWKGGRIQDGNGYWQVLLSPDDPYFVMANARGYVLEHRLLLAKHLGRALSSWECVHHRNGDKGDNSPGNLELLATQEHNSISLLIKRIQKLRAEADEEIDEFNSGYTAFENGNSIEDEPKTKYDVWKIGWVWAKYMADSRKSGGERALESAGRSLPASANAATGES